ncbi:hypothetical protein Tco_0459367 [Tanacetum coccineum]
MTRPSFDKKKELPRARTWPYKAFVGLAPSVRLITPYFGRRKSIGALLQVLAPVGSGCLGSNFNFLLFKLFSAMRTDFLVHQFCGNFVAHMHWSWLRSHNVSNGSCRSYSVENLTWFSTEQLLIAEDVSILQTIGFNQTTPRCLKIRRLSVPFLVASRSGQWQPDSLINHRLELGIVTLVVEVAVGVVFVLSWQHLACARPPAGHLAVICNAVNCPVIILSLVRLSLPLCSCGDNLKWNVSLVVFAWQVKV